MTDYRKAKTLQERLGFADPELRSPAHDELVLWIGAHLADWVENDLDRELESAAQRDAAEINEKLKELLAAKVREAGDTSARKKRLRTAALEGRLPETYGTGDRQYIVKTGRVETNEEAAARLGNEMELWLARTRKWAELATNGLALPGWTSPKLGDVIEYEVPVKSGSYIVGFIDVRARLKIPDLALAGAGLEEYRQPRRYETRTDDPEGVHFHYYSADCLYAFEAKPKIASLGELLRQLRTYQSYDESKYVVVSPDTRYRAVITAQGFGFWEAQ